MKCPKCGYTSFDYLDECKKCGTDLSTVRAMLGVIAVSPDEKALSTPSGPHAAYAEEPAPAPAAFAAADQDLPLIQHTFEAPAATPAALGEDEDIFGALVEPTSYGDKQEEDIFATGPVLEAPVARAAEPPPRAAEPPPAKPKEEEDEFLDLDFGSIFEEEEKK